MSDEDNKEVIVATDADRRYEALLDRIVDQCMDHARENLRRHHKLGSIVAEFMENIEGSKYGQRGVERLAQDLKDRDVIPDVKDATRYLYNVKSLYDAYSLEKLEALGSTGFTYTHAKLLAPLDDKTKERVEQSMFDDGSVVSTRDLEDIIREKKGEVVTETVADATETKEVTGVVIGGKGAKPSGDAPDPTEAPQTAAEMNKVEGNPPLEIAGGEDRPHQAAPTLPERVVGKPLAVLKAADKVVNQLHLKMGDIVIAVKETDRIGFDSERAQANYDDALKQLYNSMKTLLGDLVKTFEVVKDSAE